MPLPSGTRIGSYEVLDLLGEGGMGQVYRARDHKLNRDVALKVVSPLLADDPDRLARFRREAQVLASLNHPNIAQIYGFEDSGPTHALVLELVEGPTLADRIATGAIPVTDTLAIGRQIADALAVAHERGIVHRDLKPANIKIGGDTVKILDFGLAKALTDPGSQPSGSKDPGLHPSLANSPTLTARGTEIGLILGTAAYMAPEQARGKAVDRRADVWAFGVVLYEMLTGRRAFQGPEVSDVLASVLKDTPPLDALPAETPASVRRLLRRALEKDPSRRLDSMSVARLELDDVDARDGASVVDDRRAPARRLAIPIAAAILLTALGTGAALWYVRQPPAPEVVRLALTPAPDQPIGIEVNHGDIAITPDGRRIVYFTEPSNSGAQELRNRGLIVRELDQPEGRAIGKLPANARGHFTSADGRWIGFQSGPSGGRENEIRKVPIDGGASVLICGIDYNVRGASWGADQTIVFGTAQPGVGLLQVAAAGGKPEVLTTPNAGDGEADHLWPQHLPDGQHVLFAILRTDATWDVALLSLRTKTWRVLIKDGLSPRYASSGHLLYVTSSGIRAVPFDLDRLEPRGDPIEVQPGVLTKASGAADFAMSSNGTLVYLPGETYSAAETLAWREIDGRETPLRIPPQPYVALRVSPDGRLAVATVGRATTQSLWLIDLERETSIRLDLSDMEIALSVLWHPHRKEIVFGAPGRPGTKEAGGLFRLAVTGTGVPERLTMAAEAGQTPGSFSSDGRQLVFTEGTRGLNGDIRMLTYGPPSEVTTLMGGAPVEHSPALSPDGRWLAYVLVDNLPQVFVRPFPNVNDARIPVSNGVGLAPVWSHDGRQLFFMAQGGDVMVVRVEGPASIAFSKPELFIRLRDAQNEQFRVALPPVNGRVLKTVRQSTRPAVSSEYRVVLNWTQELKARVGTR